jgi:hypothetical protein
MKEICELSLVIKFDDVATVSDRRLSKAEQAAAEMRREGG